MKVINPQITKVWDLKPDDNIVIVDGEYLVVATIGWADDWAAYQGTLDWSPEKVASNGDKIGRDRAMKLFPICAMLSYRE